MLLLRRDLLRNAVTPGRIDAAQMFVGCMTKISVRPGFMRYVMKTGRYTIHEREQEMLDARQPARAKTHPPHRSRRKGVSNVLFWDFGVCETSSLSSI